MRFATVPLILAACVALAGCDDKKNVAASRGAVTSAASESSGPAEDEVAALSAPQFSYPLNLHIGADAFAAGRYAASLNGVEPPASMLPGGAGMMVGINLTPCHDTQTPPDPSTTFQASIENYGINYDSVVAWLVQSGVVERHLYPIQFTQAGDPLNGQRRTFECYVVTEMARRHLPPSMSGADIHAGFDIPLLTRKFVAWTYRNRYETQIPGLGTVKVFAGTFTYTFVSAIPGVSVSGVGTASIRSSLNPDTGKWKSDSYQGQDPSISLRTQPDDDP